MSHPPTSSTTLGIVHATVIRATELRRVSRLGSAMHPYFILSIAPTRAKRSGVLRNADRHPNFSNEPIYEFPLLRTDRPALWVELWHHRMIGGDKFIGSGSFSFRELLNQGTSEAVETWVDLIDHEGEPAGNAFIHCRYESKKVHQYIAIEYSRRTNADHCQFKLISYVNGLLPHITTG
jgi:hypothetical protein